MAFYDPFQTPEKHECKSLTRPPWFASPYIAGVGGTIKTLPELAANLSGGGFSVYMERENFQNTAAEHYLAQYPALYEDLCECARCLDLAFSYLLFVQL